MTIDRLNPDTFFEPAKAAELVAELNADPDEDWSYEVVRGDENSRWARIAVYDEDGELVGYL